MPGGHVDYDATYPDLHYDSASQDSHGPTPGAQALVDHWHRTTGLGNMGIYNYRTVVGGTSLSTHAEGRAADLAASALNPEQRRLANQYIAWLIQNARQLGVQQIIYNEWSWRADRGWRRYSGAGKNPHTDHVHVELTRGAAANPSPVWSQPPPAVRSYVYGETMAPSNGQAPTQAGGYAGGNGTMPTSDKGNGMIGAAYQPSSVADNPTAALPGESPEDYARRNYSYLAWFLNHPEIGPIIQEAAANQWDMSKLLGALSTTEWWRTSSEASRQWDAELAEDPYEAERQVRARAAEIEDLVAGVGITVDPNKLYSLAVETLRFGIDPQSSEFRNTIAGLIPRYRDQASPGTGSFAQTYEEIRRIARQDFMVGISDADAWSMAQRVVSGELTMDGVKANFAQISRGRFVAIGDILDTGITPGEYFASHRNAIADTLEMSAEQIDLLDPRWASVLNTVGSDGKQRPMTYAETLMLARSQPEWKNTTNAKASSSNLARTLVEAMGQAVF